MQSASTSRLAAVAIAVIMLTTSCSGGAEPPRPAVPGFHVEYDVSGAGETHVVVDVARPYRARTLTYAAGHPTGGTAWTEHGVYTIDSAGSAAQVSVAWPAPPGPDSHLDLALPVALREGLVQRGGSGTVLGLSCTEWLSLRPLDGADLSPPTPRERTTSCVSATGIVLRDAWTRDGHVLQARQAAHVGPAPALDDRALFGTTPSPLPSELSTYQVTAADHDRLVRLLPVPALPAPPGLPLDRSVAVLEVDRSSGAERVLREGAVFTWWDGHHLVEARFRRDLVEPPTQPTGGARVALGRLGAGRLTPVLSGLQVQVLGPRGLLLTVTGDLPEAQLLAWLRSLSF